MPYSYLNFTFRYINSKNRAKHLMPLPGKIDEEGVMLDADLIRYSDIHEVIRHYDRLAILLFPYVALARKLGQNILPGTHTILISVLEDEAKEAKSLIDQYCSAKRVYDEKIKMVDQGLEDNFRAEQCPDCKAIINVSDRKPSHYIFCKHCETIFDRLGQQIPGDDSYRICPECSYYGRVQRYPEFSFYAYPKDKRFGLKNHYCCDTCIERVFQKTVWKNIPYLVGVPFSLYLRKKYTEGRHPMYAELARANRFAQDGKLTEADELYQIMTLRNERHPGLHYNHGLAFMQADDNERAMKHFRRSLDGCSNYLPTIEVLRIHGEREVIVQDPVIDISEEDDDE